MNKKYYSSTTLEAIARKALKEYDPALISGAPGPVPLEEITEHHFGLRIEYHCLRKNGRILGLTIFDDTLVPVYDLETKQYTLIPVKGGTIILDICLLRGGTGRLRFTLAHELAHWIIHRDLFTGSGHSAALLNDKKTSAEEDSVTERQADVLGTALLMPANQVKRAYYRIRGDGAPGDITVQLAELFGVSKQAMSICLKSHRLE
ncbi:ImmA/IrrE family metallo-endopeptidase [Tyzzerella sp. OttesenSCG-928-J15]|nr:ImmA/IrrE family metallo-endopeptidase [Tyzzerella sp. OttesenSCG-928-J15]